MKLKQIIATFIAAVLALSLSVSVSAETMFDVAKAIDLNKAYQVVLTDDYMDNTLKFTVNAQTTITILMESDTRYSYYYIYNSDGEEMSSKNYNESSGDVGYNYLYWNDKTEFAKGSCDYTLLKGTYYLQLKKSYEGGNLFKFKINDPNASSVTALSLSLTLEEDDEIQLGGIVSPSSAKVTWKSSDSEIATVSSKGFVTAVSAGKVTITATAGGKSAKITIIVS
jgi:uncharacterized protein YjdB